jgi:hypothetical protein
MGSEGVDPDSTGSEQKQVVGFGKHGNKPLGSKEGKEFSAN